jgi:alkanesulfonate monooxygenase SsuD/methylene tetrahydromethanopterin reductase-like flavin-dependent oxidoreductase (luciferase family)
MTLRQATQIDDLSGGRLILGLGAGWQQREHDNYGIPFHDFRTRFELLTDELEMFQRLQASVEPVSFHGKHISISDAVLLPRPTRRTPILIGGNGPRRTLPLAARYADEWNGVYIDPATFAERSARLDELLREQGRAPDSVKRSVMIPFARVSGDDGTDQLAAYIENGCQRFMLQIVEYDDLNEIERWGRSNLQHFHNPSDSPGH